MSEMKGAAAFRLLNETTSNHWAARSVVRKSKPYLVPSRTKHLGTLRTKGSWTTMEADHRTLTAVM